MIVLSYSNIDIIQGVIGYGNAVEGIIDWRITNTSNGIFNILNSSSIIRPSGGTTEIGEIPGSTDRYMIFTAGTSTFTVPSGGIKCDILIVGGGGGGGGQNAGGGGAGGLVLIQNITLSGNFTINVGNGGSGGSGEGAGGPGINTTFTKSDNSLIITANGGGSGGGTYNIGGNGGSGGGGGFVYSNGTQTQKSQSQIGIMFPATINQFGEDGGHGGGGISSYPGGGGGGAGGIGATSGANETGQNGGYGIDRVGNFIFKEKFISSVGDNGWFAGGGGSAGGYQNTNYAYGNGGSTLFGGGGNGDGVGRGINGINGTGGGGGGARLGAGGGSGGSGIVIIRYSTANISIIDNGNTGIGTTPTINSSLLEIAGDINISGNYKINNVDIINSSSNYILSTSNLLIPRISTDIRDTSNYVSNINTTLNTRINDTSNYMLITSNILANSFSGQWTSASSGIYYNTPISTPITLPNEIGVEKYMIFTYTGDTISGSGQTQYTINIPTGGIVCDILVVGGGGGGDGDNGSGGGGGAVLYSTNVSIPANTYTIKVGKGGLPNVNGSSSEAFGAICLGGGSTSYVVWPGANNGTSGGSGSGGSSGYALGTGGGVGVSTKGILLNLGTIYNGNIGGNGLGQFNGGTFPVCSGGGGGAGTAGLSSTQVDYTTRDSWIAAGRPGRGGDGVAINITGTSYYWGAGGGGGSFNTHSGDGGLGGGGGGGAANRPAGLAGTGGINSSTNGSVSGGDGAPNSGSGGGGGGNGGNGGTGGSGIIIIKYNTIQQTIPKSIISLPVITPTIITGITTGTIGTTDSYMMFTYTIDNTGSGQTQYTINTRENLVCDILIVGGGGAGGTYIGGGGGAGGVLYILNTTIPIGTYNISVGRGGLGFSGAGASTTSQNGISSKAFGIEVFGGGYGGAGGWGSGIGGQTGGSGGSSGAGGSAPSGTVGVGGSITLPNLTNSVISINTYNYYGGSGASSMIFNGNAAGSVGANGGGGAGGNAPANTDQANAGAGADGIAINITGTSYFWGGGGGGGQYAGGKAGNGGKGGGGGGNGSQSTEAVGIGGTGGITLGQDGDLEGDGTPTGGNGGAGTGGGGGGTGRTTGSPNAISGSGGSGIVIIRYRRNTITAYVGIGTTNPVSELHLYDDANNNTKLTVQNSYTVPVSITPNIIESLVLPNTLFTTNPTGVTSGTINDTDRFYIFTHTGGYNTNTAYNNISIPNGITFDILMIGGGGAGGGIGGAGGGSGACLVAVNQTLPAGTYTFVVGGAGSGGITGSGNIGYDTYIHFSGTEIYKARGGGGGSADAKNGVIGGCSGGAAGGINNIAYTSPSPATNNLYQTLTSGPIVNTTLLYSIYANKGGDVTATTTYETINYGGGGGIGAAAANANTTTRSTPGGDGLYQVTLNGTLYNFRTHFTNNGTFGVQDGTTGKFFIGGGGGGGGYNPSITPTNISGGKGGGGIGKNGNSPSNGTDGMPNTGSGGGAGSTGLGGNSLGGNGGSGLLIFRYRNRAKYTVTDTLENNIYYKTLTFTYSPNYPANPANTTLLAWYRFDGDGLDYSPWTTKYNLIANVGTPTYSSGTATDSFLQGRRYINTGTGSLRNTSLSLASRAFSIAVWQRKKNSSIALFIAQSASVGGNISLHIGQRENNVYTIDYYGNGLNSVSYPDDINMWVHIVYVVLSNNNRRIYRNGVLIATDSNTTAFTGSGDLRIGVLYSNNTANQNIDFSDLRIYNNGLSSTEVEQLYNSYTSLVSTNNFSVNFPNTTSLLVNGTSKTVKGQYNISSGHINSSILPLEGQSDIPFASTAITTVAIKYAYDNYLPNLPNEIGIDQYMIFRYTTETAGAGTGQTQYTINIPTGGITCDILIVGGGGGGGNAIYWSSHEPGGGGAGGVVYMVNKSLSAGTYKINVGNGGAGNTNGNNSTITDNNNNILTFDNILLIGKGGGKGATTNTSTGGDGGSGGGGGHDRTNGGTATQGNTFWNGTTYIAGGNNGARPGGGSSGGGGGGAGEAGDTDGGGCGGDGVQVSITGTNTFYAGGGNAYYNTSTIRSDGGGGTLNGTGSQQNGGSALPNTGSGGSGGYTTTSSTTGGSGGSGIVIIKCTKTQQAINSTPSLISQTVTKGIIGTTDRTISFTYTSDSTGLIGQTLYSFTPVQNIICDILVVGGGGGGGKGGGGGGGGGVLLGVNLKLNAGSAVSIKVGDGGNGATTNDNGVNGINGFDSSITINSVEYIAKGGGGGGTRGVNAVGTSGNAGGSGGGGSHANSAPQGQGGASNKNIYVNFQSFGNTGGLGKLGTAAPEPSHASGGGGGAGSVGSNASGSGTGTGGGNGGLGKEFIAFFGTSVGHNGYFAGGGGGNTYSNAGIRGYGNGGLESYGGGGNAGFDGTIPYFADNGLPNTGGGGGGAFFAIYSYNSNSGGKGGSGFVIIRYRINTIQTSSVELIKNTVPPNEILVAGTTSTTIGQFDRLISFPYTGDSTGLVGQTQYTFTTTENLICDILIVGGGGSGSETHGGGGGAGAVIFMKNVNMNGSYTIKVGKGGVCQVTGGFNGLGRKGIDSEIFKTNNISNKIVAEGGGGGGELTNANGGSGGSGGGGDAYNVAIGVGGVAIAYTPILDGVTGIKYGNNGGNAFGNPGNGGGGGGAGGAGENALAFNDVENERAHGGVGIKSATINSVNYDFKTLFGTNTGGGVLEADGFLYFGGGGGNGRWLRDPYGNEGGNGGLGGGGKGGWGGSGVQTVPLNGRGYPGINGTGGGGGGGGDYTPAGGDGGSGIVIIRYRRNTGYKIGNYNGDFKIISSSTGGDTDYMRITADGSSIYNPTGSPLWSTVSDRRIKENIEKASYDKCYDNINKLELYRFNYIKELNNINKDNKQLGYIAQEVEDIFPKAVSSQVFYNNSLSISDLLSIDISQINYSLYGAIKKLIEIYNNVDKRIDVLEKILNIENDLHIVLPDISTTTNNISFYKPPETNIVVDTLTISNIIDILSVSIMSIYTSNNIIYDISTSNNIGFYTPSTYNYCIDTIKVNNIIDTSITSNLNIDTLDILSTSNLVI